MYVPHCTYGLRVPACCVLYGPEAQGSLPLGPTHCTYAVRVPASAVPYVPRTVAHQVYADVLRGLRSRPDPPGRLQRPDPDPNPNHPDPPGRLQRRGQP
eukprot:scaffold16296_cov63-Phaeocystis_antarctica.AAC.2